MKLFKFLIAFVKSFFVSSKDFKTQNNVDPIFEELVLADKKTARYFHEKYSGKKRFVKAPRIKSNITIK